MASLAQTHEMFRRFIAEAIITEMMHQHRLLDDAAVRLFTEWIMRGLKEIS